VSFGEAPTAQNPLLNSIVSTTIFNTVVFAKLGSFLYRILNLPLNYETVSVVKSNWLLCAGYVFLLIIEKSTFFSCSGAMVLIMEKFKSTKRSLWQLLFFLVCVVISVDYF
jgi:hypothetical protein